MIVVFDTNIWKANIYLRSPAAAAVKLILNMKSAKVGLPEVVKLEVEHHLRKDIMSIRNNISDQHERLLAIFGSLLEVKLPTDEQIEKRVSNYFNESGFDIKEISFSYRAARNSFLRTIDNVRPSHKKQEFKDGVLWENCKTFANKSEVVLVTGDKAFFEQDDPNEGLAKDLSQEADGCRYRLSVLPSLSDLLRDIEEPIIISDQVLDAAINEQLGTDIVRLLERAGFDRSDARFKTTFYATGNPNILYVEFTAEFVCEDTIGEERTDAVLRLKGDGSYSHSTNLFSGLSPIELSVAYLNNEGEQEEKRHHYMRAEGIVIGHRTVSHEVRQKLSN